MDLLAQSLFFLLGAAAPAHAEPAALVRMDWSAVFGLGQLVVIIGATGIAWLTYRQAKKREKTNNSFEHIARQTRDHDLIGMFEEFRRMRMELRDGHEGSFGLDQVEGRLIDYNQRALNAEDIVKKVFNYYEATAIGLKSEALDEQMIKDWWRRSYVLDWSDFARYVREKRERDHSPKLYVEYETYVKRWARPDEEALI